MGKDYQRLWRGVAGAANPSSALPWFFEIRGDDPYGEGLMFLLSLKGEDAETCLALLDHYMSDGRANNLPGSQRVVIFTTAQVVAYHYTQVLPSLRLTGKVQVEDKIIASGGFANLRHGRYMGNLVAVKTMRVAAQGDLSRMRREFCCETTRWKKISHPNVMKLTGVLGDTEKGQFVTVAELMAHGNIMEYIRENRANRLELLQGAAQGLEYLHSSTISHGSLKGANILISNDAPPRACLTDFLFKDMSFDPIPPIEYYGQSEGNVMVFNAPELLMPWKFGKEEPTYTKETDIYAFAFVILQVLTGETPFHRLRQTQLMYYAVEGRRPDKPDNASAIGLSDSLWSLVQRCWNMNAESRPNVGEVVTCLREAAANWHQLMPPHGA